MTLEEAGKMLGRSRERVRQLAESAYLQLERVAIRRRLIDPD